MLLFSMRVYTHSQIVELGKLKKVALREVWVHEAYTFTKCLSEEENLTLLGDEKVFASPSSTQSCAADCFGRCSRRTNLPRPSNFVVHSERLTALDGYITEARLGTLA